MKQRFIQYPQVISCSRLQGLSGSTVSVCVQSAEDLISTPGVTFMLAFASKRVVCALQHGGDPSLPTKQYVLSAEVPPFPTTGWHSFDVPLRLMMESGSIAIPNYGVPLGQFSFASQTISQVLPRKRRYSSESQEEMQRPIKKPSAQHFADGSSESGVFQGSPYSPFTSTPVVPTLSQGNGRNTPSRHQGHSYSASAASANSVKAQSPQTPASWSPNFASAKQVDHVSKHSADHSQRSSEEDLTDSAPSLIRTSTMQQPSVTLNAPQHPQSFNPYAMYPSKAVLKLNGNLDNMAEGWSHDEWDAKRRLVQFTRTQDGSTIHADFKAVAPEDRQPNSICISCIWWEEKKDCFVTSVDTIFLLESLVAVRFTVEEKNRIRRNLEGFRPLTVSKSKVESEEFFKVIMGFPSPKPRNIEKDVKVFPWKILAHALKKIIGKYSASYSSTASALPTTMISHYVSHGSPDSGVDIRCSASPQPININHAPSPHAIHTPSFSPHLVSQDIVSVPVSSGPPTDLRLQVPSVVPGYSYPATHSHPSPYPQQFRGSPQPMTAPPAAGRVMESWDDAAYSVYGNSNADGSSIDTYHYNRALSGLSAPQAFLPTAAYSLSTSGI